MMICRHNEGFLFKENVEKCLYISFYLKVRQQIKIHLI